MIYILYGPDSYRSREKLNEIIKAYREKAKGVLGIERFDAEVGEAAALGKLAGARSLFQKKKLIVIEQPSLGDEIFIKVLKSKAKEWQEDENTIVVIWDGGSGKTKWLTSVESHAANTHQYKTMTPAEAKRWLSGHLKKKNLHLSSEIENQLVERFSGDTWQLVNEAEKVAMGGEMASPADISDKKIFTLLDFVFLDRIRTLQSLVALRNSGVNEQYIWSAVINHLRLLLIITDGHGLGSEAGTHPYVLQKATSKARRLERAHVRALYEKLFDEDLKIKIGMSDPYSSLISIILAS